MIDEFAIYNWDTCITQPLQCHEKKRLVKYAFYLTSFTTIVDIKF